MKRLLHFALLFCLFASLLPTRAFCAPATKSVLLNQPTQADIDAAIGVATVQGRIIRITSGGMSIPAAMKELTSLPVIFRTLVSDHPYDIVVLQMNFTPTGATLVVGSRFQIPQTENYLYFGQSDVPFSGKTGFKADMPILASSLSTAGTAEMTGPFAAVDVAGFKNHLSLALNKDSKLSLSCGAFNQFQLSGYAAVSGIVEKENADGSAAADSPLTLPFANQAVSDWKDMLLDATASTGFHAANYADLGFHFNGTQAVRIDLSETRNVQSLPSCASINGENWKGVVFPSFQLRLPRFFKLRDGVTLGSSTGNNLLMDGNGLIGSIAVDKVYSLSQGYSDEINRYDMSLDKLSANFGCNGDVTVSMLGQIGLPWCGAAGTKSDAPLLSYSFRYANSRYEVFLKDKPNGSFSSNKYGLTSGSDVILNLSEAGLAVKTYSTEKPVISADAYNNSVCKGFPVNFTATGCGEGRQLIWSTGATGATLTTRPLETTSFFVKCQDDYCVSGVSDSLKITVYESLPAPALLAGRDALCLLESTDLRAENCVGKIEWQLPGENGFSVRGNDERVQNARFESATGTFNYAVRCNLNGCFSPVTTKTINVHALPAAPSLYSNAPNNTIDRNGQVTLAGNCQAGARLDWENLPQPTVTLTNTSVFQASCVNEATGCRSANSSSITIQVLYLPPAAPSNIVFTEVGINFLQLAWQDHANNEDGYMVLRSTNADFAGAQTIANLLANTTSYRDNGLSAATQYYYQIVAYNRYDQAYSERASQSTIAVPTAPVIQAVSSRIVRGTKANLTATCQTGTLVWTVPVGYGGGEWTQNSDLTYWAKCVNAGFESPGANYTVTVYDPKPGVPVLSAASTRIERGSNAVVTGRCDTGTLVWTVPVGFNGGQWQQHENTTYWAKCVNNGFESDGANITVAVFDIPQAARPILRADKNPVKPGENTVVYADGCDGTIVWSNGATGNSIWTGAGDYSAICRKDGHRDSERAYYTVGLDNTPTELPQAPRPNLRKERESVKLGERTDIYADGCDGTVVWSTGDTGNRIHVGSGDYSAVCRKDGYRESERAYINVPVDNNPPPQAPRPNLRADKNPVKPGENTVVYADGCDGTIVWSNGATRNSIWTGAGDYSAICRKDGHRDSERAYITVSLDNTPTELPQAPRPNLRADKNPVKPGENTVVYADGCDGTVVWSNGATGNSIWTGAGDYSAICRKDGHRDSERAYITVSLDNTPTELPQAPRPNLRADKNPVKPGENTVVYADGCDGTVVWSNGATGNSIWTGAGDYSAVCRKDGYRESERAYMTISVNNNPDPQAPRPNLRKERDSVKPGERMDIYADGCDGTVVWSTGDTGNRINVGAGDYSAVCQKDGYRESDRAYINVPVDNNPPPQAPRPNLRADKNPVKPGENTVVYADGCDGTVVWSNGATGNSIWTGAGDYSAVCRKDGYRESERAYMTISVNNNPDPQAPRPNLRKERDSVKPGERMDIYADGCDGTVVWSTGDTGHRIHVGAGDYSAVCRKDGYRESDRAYINVPVDNNPPPQLPRPNLWADKYNVRPGELTRIHASGCDGMVIWSNGQTVNDFDGGAGDYSAFCRKDGYQDSQSNSITINLEINLCPSPPQPTISAPDEVKANSRFFLSVNGCSGATFTSNFTDGPRYVEAGMIPFFHQTISSDTYYQMTCIKDGCPPASASKTVRATPACATPAAPYITGPSKVNKGEEVKLTATGCDEASTFNWSGPGNPLARIPAGSSTFAAVVYNETLFTVTCTVQGGCTSPPATFVVGVVNEPTIPDDTWVNTGLSCGGTGFYWKNKRTGQMECRGGISCVTYKITVYDGSSQYSNDPNSCNSCTVYTGCDGQKRVGSFSGMTSQSTPYTIEAQENSIECRGCYADPINR